MMRKSTRYRCVDCYIHTHIYITFGNKYGVRICICLFFGLQLILLCWNEHCGVTGASSMKRSAQCSIYDHQISKKYGICSSSSLSNAEKEK